MTDKILQNLDGVPKTSLMTLYARARESQRVNPLIKDALAVEMISRIDCDFSQLQMQRHDEVATMMRLRKFDNHVRDFLVKYPAGVVVHIGCGLDTRFQRVDNGQVTWFDLDLPEVIALREKLLPDGPDRYHTLATSVHTNGWLSAVEEFKPRPFLFVSEGVLVYFQENEVKALFLKLRDHFPGCELACDEVTPFFVWADNMHLALAGLQARMHWGIRRAKDAETWGAGIHLLDSWNYFEDKEPAFRSFAWMRWIPGAATGFGIYHYRLDGPDYLEIHQQSMANF